MLDPTVIIDSDDGDRFRGPLRFLSFALQPRSLFSICSNLRHPLSYTLGVCSWTIHGRIQKDNSSPSMPGLGSVPTVVTIESHLSQSSPVS
jgi:hypothetical protein